LAHYRKALKRNSLMKLMMNAKKAIRLRLADKTIRENRRKNLIKRTLSKLHNYTKCLKLREKCAQVMQMVHIRMLQKKGFQGLANNLKIRRKSRFIKSKTAIT